MGLGTLDISPEASVERALHKLLAALVLVRTLRASSFLPDIRLCFGRNQGVNRQREQAYVLDYTRASQNQLLGKKSSWLTKGLMTRVIIVIKELRQIHLKALATRGLSQGDGAIMLDKERGLEDGKDLFVRNPQCG